MAAPQEEDEEDLLFNVEETQKIIRDNIELILGGNMYSHSRTPQWIGLITDKTMARIGKLNKPFKYINVGYLWVKLSGNEDLAYLPIIRQILLKTEEISANASKIAQLRSAAK